MSPYENVTIGNSFEEIVFTNRNKAYGAYMLHKKEKKYLIVAFFISFMLVSASVITPFILNQFKDKKPVITVYGPVVGPMDSTLFFEPPKPPEIQLQSLSQTLLPPLVVEELDSMQNDDFGPVDAYINRPNPAPPIDITPVDENSDTDIQAEPRPFITVEIPATFQGGTLADFNKWVNQQIVYPSVPLENGISGRVFIQFVVNSKGKVEDVTILRGADPALDEEAVRVIKSSPDWTPPLQGGRPVKQLFSLPVTFKINQ